MVKLGITIPTINRADLLVNLVSSLGKQEDDFEICYIIDNGHQGLSSNRDKFVISTEDKNLGVSGSWNKGISHIFNTTDCTHVLVLNDDIVLGQDQLKPIIEVIENNLDKWFLVGPYYWSVFVMSRECTKYMSYSKNKYFDEAFFPAYFEDNDFYRRITLLDPTKYLPNVSAFSPESYINSGSKQKDPHLTDNFPKNKSYYISKWGGEPQKERFITPFNR